MNLWDLVSKAINNRKPKSQAAAEVEEWNRIPQEVINNLIFSMCSRVDALLGNQTII